MSNKLISVKNINLKYTDKKIIDNVTFTLNKGDFVTIVGPNGAGKSSLLKILLGLIKKDSGTIERAKDIRIGYTPQFFKPNIFMPISVRGFLILNQKAENSFIEKISRDTGVIDLLDIQLKNLSGGQLQKVLLTRALINKPNVLLLDEPAQNLDLNGQIKLYQLIQDIHQNQNCAILMISHDLHMVMRESTQVICLYHHICCQGRPDKIIKDEKFNNLFADQMAELMATYEHNHNHKH